MNYVEYKNNKDIKFALDILTKELNRRKNALDDVTINVQIDSLYEDVHCIQSAITKIVDKWSLK